MRIILTLTLLLSSLNCFSAGSFDFETDLLPVLATNPHLKEILFQNFEFAESGGANRIGYKVNKNLGGARFGPYHIKAKPKGKEGDFSLSIIVYTEAKFIGPDGIEVAKDQFRDAVSVKEIFYSYQVLPAGKESAFVLENNF